MAVGIPGAASAPSMALGAPKGPAGPKRDLPAGRYLDLALDDRGQHGVLHELDCVEAVLPVEVPFTGVGDLLAVSGLEIPTPLAVRVEIDHVLGCHARNLRIQNVFG